MIVNDYKSGLDPRVNLTTVKVVFVALPIIFLIELAISSLVKDKTEVKQENIINHEHGLENVAKMSATKFCELRINNGVLYLDAMPF